MSKKLEEIGLALLAKKGTSTLFKGKILSQSMEPLLKVGMYLKVERVDFGTIRVGDIICYERTRVISGKKRKVLLVHRLVRLDKKRRIATVKGDNVAKPDTDILPQEFIGKAVSFIHRDKEYELATSRLRLINGILTFYSLLECHWSFFQAVPKGKKRLTKLICGF